VQSATGVDYSRGDTISISGLQFEGVVVDKKAQDDFNRQYQQQQLLYFIGSSVIPLVVILLMGGFALLILRSFVNKMPSAKRMERKLEEMQEPLVEESEPDEDTVSITLDKKEIRSQKDQSINELNEAVMTAPEEAAKLLVSYIKDN
jgi:flagellar biosynthesis/type III secretory pathway M-ring protein FliF/YscJ